MPSVVKKKKNPVKIRIPAAEMFPENPVQVTTMSFHSSSTLAGWKLVKTVPLRKEIYLDLFILKKRLQYLNKKRKKKIVLTLKM